MKGSTITEVLSSGISAESKTTTRKKAAAAADEGKEG